ncbi:hypothetical protein B0T25DRAFT_429087, partial [Lasiosphaeria hispida]
TPSRGSSGSRGSASRGSSPTKRLRTLALQDDGVEVRSLQRGARSLPASLRNMLDDFERIAGGRHILPGENKAEFENEAEKDMSVSRFEGYHFAPAGARGKLGEVPSIARIKRIMSWAMHCQETAAHETTWNSAVHFPLLDMALYGEQSKSRPTCLLRDVVGSTKPAGAGIIQEYLPSQTGGEKVDFVMGIEPDAPAANAINQLRRDMPFQSINHTDLTALSTRPIVVSMETKRTGQSDQGAALQIGLWQAA